MTKEIPLSLQVFHSLNEYKAHRRNKTEQLRLHDLQDVLKREEKLYAKEYALHKNKFYAQYARRLSAPSAGLSERENGNSTPFSKPDRSARLFSAPAAVNRTTSTELGLASRMFESMSGISTSSRFQRIQRKFSIASFTENGMLTKRGSVFSKNIAEARKILFNKASFAERDEDNEDYEEKEEEKEKEESGRDFLSEEQTLELVASHNVVGGAAEEKEEKSCRENKHKERTLAARSSQGRQSDLETIKNNTHTSCTGSPQPDNEQIGTCSLSDIDHSNALHSSNSELETQFSENSRPATVATLLGSRKRVSIQTPPAPDVIQEEEEGEQEAKNDFSRKSSAPRFDEESFTDWKSMFTKPPPKPVNPLQQKVKEFLSSQKDFNRLFPSGRSSPVEHSSIHKELVEKERQKREQRKVERKRKSEIVFEVLDKLGIDDENTLFSYREHFVISHK